MKAIYYFFRFIIVTIWNAINAIRKLVSSLLVLALIYLIFYSLGQSQMAPMISAKGALILNIDSPIVEKPTQNSPLSEGFSLKTEAPIILFDLVDTIKNATNDPNITGIVLQLNSMPRTSLTSLRYIGRALNAFKASGKPIYAVGDNYLQSQYYLASFADEILMSKQGGVLLEGLGSYHLYYKDLLDSLKVSTHIFRVGTYKSAVEPFIRNSMSDEAKENAQALIDELWGSYLADIIKNRALNPNALKWRSEELLSKLKEAGGDLAQFSLNQKLVDELLTQSEINQKLVKAFGKEEYSYQSIDYRQYFRVLEQRRLPLQMMKKERDGSKSTINKIAVITVDGTIVDGRSKPGMAGGDTIVSLLREAKNDKNVKGVILRVNSPGGSAFASEVIREGIDELQENNKPVVVSMGSVAASGGYWISTSADSIIAQPTTITGSIGIFGMFATFENTLSSLGMYSDGVATTDFANIDLTRPLSKTVEQFMQLTVEHGYNQFITLVSKHRKISLEKMDEIAQGRVWSGEEALKHGLVDALGDFDDAQKAMTALLGIDSDNYELEWKSKDLNLSQSLRQLLSGSSDGVSIKSTIQSYLRSQLVAFISEKSDAVKKVTRELRLFGEKEDPKGLYIYCLNCLVE